MGIRGIGHVELMRPDFLYVARGVRDGRNCLKIGCSRVVESRCKALRMTLIAKRLGTYRAECLIHRVLRRFRFTSGPFQKEFYVDVPEVVEVFSTCEFVFDDGRDVPTAMKVRIDGVVHQINYDDTPYKPETIKPCRRKRERAVT